MAATPTERYVSHTEPEALIPNRLTPDYYSLEAVANRYAARYALMRKALEAIYTDIDGSLETCRNRARQALEETD